MLSIGLCTQLACIWEATARKPGNVSRFHDFADVGYLDFILSAAAIAPILEEAANRPVGQTILDAVTEVLKIARSAIEPAPRLSQAQARLLGRVANLEKQRRMIQLIEPDCLVDESDGAALARMAA